MNPECKVKNLLKNVSVTQSPWRAEGCESAPADVHRQCVAEHHGQVSWAPGDQE